MSEATAIKGRSIAQSLAVQSQIHLAGTAGRILKQIRDLERLGPIFAKAGLVRAVDRPNPLNLRVAGISTARVIRKVLGGFLYVAAANRVDLNVENNVISTTGQDSVCEIDDINYENQAKRLDLINIRQAYKMIESALRSPERYDLILVDSPLLLNRGMVPPYEAERYAGMRREYETTHEAIVSFWNQHREILYPWNPQGAVLAGIASERFGAIIGIAQQDLRTAQGRRQVLSSERIDETRITELVGSESAILGIGQNRFIYGLLQRYTRTVAFKMNIQTPRMEPSEVADLGLLGFHFKAAPRTMPTLLYVIGDEPLWTSERCDFLAGQVMALGLTRGESVVPLPIQLAAREQKGLANFIDYFGKSVESEIKNKGIENLWLSDLNETDLEN
jgi:hypothetical protein